MNMMNKCAKFHKDSPSGKKIKFKLDVGRQSRILNTTQNWVVSKASRSIAHQTWYMETMLQWTQNWSKIKTKLGQGKC